MAGLENLVKLYVLVVVGVLMRRFIFSREKSEKLIPALSAFIMEVPFSFLMLQAGITANLSAIAMAVAAVALMLASLFASSLFAKLFKAGNISREIVLSSTWMNVAFLPIPIAAILFGAESTSQVMAFVAVSNIVFLMLMPHLVSRKKGKLLDFTVFFEFPPSFFMLAGLLIGLLGLKLPVVLLDSIDWIAALTTPLVLIVLGLDLEFKLPNIKGTAIIGLTRFIVIPALVIVALILTGFGLNHPSGRIILLECLMPPALSAAMFADKFGLDRKFVSASTMALTTIFLVALPVLALAFGWA